MAEGSIASSLTSTTLAGMSPSAPAAGAHPLALLDSVGRPNRHAFLQPPAAIPASSLSLVKDTLESFAGRVGDEQQRLVREANRKRKRSERIRADDAEVLKVRRIHVDGFETGQVWQQAKKVIASTLQSSEEALRELEEQSGVNGHVEDEDSADVGSEASGEEDYDEEDFSADEEAANREPDEVLAENEYDSEDEAAANQDMDELMAEAEAEEDGELESIDEEGEESEEEPAEDLVEDVHGLNDQFFSIDNFNKQTQWFEEQDARGDPNTDLADDDEEVDWDANPFTSVKSQPKGKKSVDDSDADMDEPEDEDGDDEDGPTFGNMDLNAPEGESDMEDDLDPEADEDDSGENANDVFYKDFFAPPPRKKKDQPPKKSVRFQPDDADVDRAMADVKRDLFEDVSDEGGSDEEALSDASAGDPRSRRSAHERRQAKIVDEIRKLEAAAVAKREWTLSGEASAVERPVNSLLEENLDFEHIGKPVPVITPEVTESIEDLIKRRILAGEFDDISRRRPDAEVSDARRGLVALDDTKSKKGLAELYEEDHLKSTNPDTYVSKADEKLAREEAEVAGMWRDVCARLDALSSWHYKPRPAAPAITVVSDVAAVAMEDAQPATAQGVAGGESAVAPQEVYKPGKGEDGEVVRGGVPVARGEMSREEKTRRRRRAKERGRKEGGGERKEAGKGSKKDTVADLKRGGVRVINRRGEVLDVEGNKAKAQKGVSSGGFKL